MDFGLGTLLVEKIVASRESMFDQGGFCDVEHFAFLLARMQHQASNEQDALTRSSLLQSHHEPDIVELLLDARSEFQCLANVQRNDTFTEPPTKNIYSRFTRNALETRTHIDQICLCTISQSNRLIPIQINFHNSANHS